MKRARQRWQRDTGQTTAEFARLLAREAGWDALSESAIYDWEAERTNVPGVALLIAADLAGLGVDQLLGPARDQPESSKSSEGLGPVLQLLSGHEQRISTLEKGQEDLWSTLRDVGDELAGIHELLSSGTEVPRVRATDSETRPPVPE